MSLTQRRSSRRWRAAIVATTVAASVGVVGLASTTASAALPTCNAVYYLEFASHTRYLPFPIYRDSAGHETARCQLAYGNAGDPVRVLQTALNRCNGATPRLVEDGRYGRHTRDAVYAFQRRHHPPLDIDGIYGPATGGAMKWPAYFDADGRFAGCYAVTINRAASGAELPLAGTASVDAA